MTSPTCVKISKFWWNGFKIEYWTSKYLFLFLNIFQSTLVNEILIWTFLTHFWVGNVATGVKISKFGASSFKNEYFISNFLLLLTSSLYYHGYMIYKCGPFLTHFLVNEFTAGVKTCKILRKWSQKQTVYFKFPSIFISIVLSPSIHDIKFRAIFV